MVSVPGVEPGTCRLGGGRSIRLSYTLTRPVGKPLSVGDLPPDHPP